MQSSTSTVQGDRVKFRCPGRDSITHEDVVATLEAEDPDGFNKLFI